MYRRELMCDIFLSGFRPQDPFACVHFARAHWQIPFRGRFLSREHLWRRETEPYVTRYRSCMKALANSSRASISQNLRTGTSMDESHRHLYPMESTTEDVRGESRNCHRFFHPGYLCNLKSSLAEWRFDRTIRFLLRLLLKAILKLNPSFQVIKKLVGNAPVDLRRSLEERIRQVEVPSQQY